MKRYKFELGSETVDELFENSTEAEILVTSHFTLLEVNAVAARLLKGGVIQLQQYHSVLGRFAQDVSDFDLIVMPLLSGMITEAIELLEEYPLRSADALHFASAVAANRASDEREFYVVSADREIVDASPRRRTFMS